MIRVGISGTNWTRKTTTIRKVVEALDPEPVEVIALSDLVARCPYPLGPQQTLDGSRWMTDRVAEILDAPRPVGTIQLFDRTPLDIYAFTLYVVEHEATAPAKNTAELFEEIGRLGAQFRRIFLCRPAGDWPAPENPSPEELEFAKQIDADLVVAAKKWSQVVTEVPWSQCDHLNGIRKLIAQGKDSREFAN